MSLLGLVANSSFVFRCKKNSHRLYYFLNNRLYSILTNKKEQLNGIASLFGTLNQLSAPSLSKALLFASITSALAITPKAHALPTGATVENGSVSFNQTGNTLNVNAETARSIVNYQSFNVNSAETVNFNLPATNAAILNRVVGPDPSAIAGKINSNGQVFLVNPNGIVFGSQAQVNVGSLFASTLNISSSDFMSGIHRFSKGTAAPKAILNAGKLQANGDGYIALTGSGITNNGQIVSGSGPVHLAVGDQVTATIDNGLLVDVIVDQGLSQNVSGYTTAIANTGKIQTNGNLLKLQTKLANALYSRAINNSGIIETNALADNAGQIELVATSTNNNAQIYSTGKIQAIGESTSGAGSTIQVNSNVFLNYGQISSIAPQHSGKLTLLATKQIWLGNGSNITSFATQAGGHSGMIQVVSGDSLIVDPGAYLSTDYDTVVPEITSQAGDITLSAQGSIRFVGHAYNSGTTPDGTFRMSAGKDITLLGTGDAIRSTAIFGFENVYLTANRDMVIDVDVNAGAIEMVGSTGVVEISAANHLKLLSGLGLGNTNATFTADSDRNNTGILTIEALSGPYQGYISSGQNISFTGSQINYLQGAIQASHIVFAPSVNKTVLIGTASLGANTSFNIPTSFLLQGNVSAQTVTIGSLTNTGQMLLASDLYFNTGSGVFGNQPVGLLKFVNGSTFSSNGKSIYLAYTPFHIQSGKAMTVGPISSPSSVTLISGQNMNITGDLSANTLALATQANNGSISLKGNLNAYTTSLSTHGFGSITQASGFNIQSDSLSFNVGTGNVGGMSTPLHTAVSNLTLQSGGYVYLTEADDIFLNDSSVTKLLSLRTLANGSISAYGIIQAGTMLLDADWSIVGGRLIAPQMTLSARNGDIGQPGVPLALQVDAGVLTLSTPGSVLIEEQNAITLAKVTANNTVSLTAAGNITVNGSVTGSQIGLNSTAGSITLNGSLGTASTTDVSVQAGTKIQVTKEIDAQSIWIKAQSGDISIKNILGKSAPAQIIKLIAGNDIVLSTTGVLNASQEISLLTENGAQFLSGVMGNADTNYVSVQSNKGIYIYDTAKLTSTGSSSGQISLYSSHGEAIVVKGLLKANHMQLDAPAGAMYLNGTLQTVDGSGTGTINTNAFGNITIAGTLEANSLQTTSTNGSISVSGKLATYQTILGLLGSNRLAAKSGLTLSNTATVEGNVVNIFSEDPLALVSIAGTVQGTSQVHVGLLDGSSLPTGGRIDITDTATVRTGETGTVNIASTKGIAINGRVFGNRINIKNQSDDITVSGILGDSLSKTDNITIGSNGNFHLTSTGSVTGKWVSINAYSAAVFDGSVIAEDSIHNSAGAGMTLNGTFNSGNLTKIHMTGLLSINHDLYSNQIDLRNEAGAIHLASGYTLYSDTVNVYADNGSLLINGAIGTTGTKSVNMGTSVGNISVSGTLLANAISLYTVINEQSDITISGNIGNIDTNWVNISAQGNIDISGHVKAQSLSTDSSGIYTSPSINIHSQKTVAISGSISAKVLNPSDTSGLDIRGQNHIDVTGKQGVHLISTALLEATNLVAVSSDEFGDVIIDGDIQASAISLGWPGIPDTYAGPANLIVNQALGGDSTNSITLSATGNITTNATLHANYVDIFAGGSVSLSTIGQKTGYTYGQYEFAYYDNDGDRHVRMITTTTPVFTVQNIRVRAEGNITGGSLNASYIGFMTNTGYIDTNIDVQHADLYKSSTGASKQYHGPVSSFTGNVDFMEYSGSAVLF